MIGVLAIQGDFIEHAAMLRESGAEVREVRLPFALQKGRITTTLAQWAALIASERQGASSTTHCVISAKEK
jgi:glutamine amidotransferase PdxT